MKIFGRKPGLFHNYRRGQLSLHSPAEIKTLQPLFTAGGIEMANLVESMHACIGAAGGEQGDLLIEDVLESFLNSLTDAGLLRVILALPSAEIGSVIRYCEFYPGHRLGLYIKNRMKDQH